MTAEYHTARPHDPGPDPDYEFDEFIRANPHIYKKFGMLAVKLGQGIDRWGVKSLWEVLRWDLAMETNAPIDGPALNNNYTSRMARKLMADEPEDFTGFFNYANSKAMVELLLCATPVPRTTSLCPLATTRWVVTTPRQPTPVGVRCTD